MFRVAREDAVRQICEKLRQKLNEFYELESYDWLLVEPTGHASSYISDLIAFLQTTFQSFTNLPVSIEVHMRGSVLVVQNLYCACSVQSQTVLSMHIFVF